MKEALLIVDGIRDKTRVIKDVKGSLFPTNHYKEIIRAETEEIFDTTVPWFIRWIPKVNGWYDQYVADVFALFRNKTARMAVCREVRNQIFLLEAKGYRVDVLCYSLGTIIMLCCGPNPSKSKKHKKKPVQVRNLFIYNSPLGFAFLWLGLRVRSFVRKYGTNVKAEEIECIYGRKDIVSKNVEKKAKDIIQGFTTFEPKYFPNDARHDLVTNINLRYKKSSPSSS